MMSDTKKIWMRLEGESDAPYQAFRNYLSSPPPRSITELSKEMGLSRNTLFGYSTRFSWQKRVRAWDEAVIAANDQAIVDEYRKITREQLRALAMVRKLGTAEMARRYKLYADDPDGNHGVTVRNALSMVDRATQLECAIYAAAIKLEDDDQELDVSELDAEEADVLIHLLTKVGAYSEDDDAIKRSREIAEADETIETIRAYSEDEDASASGVVHFKGMVASGGAYSEDEDEDADQ